jgi:electron transfer flavoprotein alpha/beta subunit
MGFTADAAYAHIVSFNGNKSVIRADLMIFIDKAARDSNASHIGFMTAELLLAHGASMQEMYDALKLQEPFINAIDI